VVFLISAFPAAAALLLSDSFDYPDGALVAVSTNGWVHHSGSVTGEVSVASGRVRLSDANTEDVSAPLAGQPYPASSNTNMFYAAFTIRFASLPSVGGTYFAHFKGPSATDFRARIWALTGGAAPGRFRLGISSTGGAAVNMIHPMDLNLNTDYTVVSRLANTNSVGTLWINPASENEPGVTTTEAVSTFTVSGFAFRENTGEGQLNVDNLRVGTSFADVQGISSGQSPLITVQPRSQTATHGDEVTFRADAIGTPPPGFQWQFNGTNLPGAVSSNLTLTGVTFAQSGVYTVIATNPAGSALSDPAVLNIWRAAAPAFSVLTYNVHGNGLTNWSTNLWHVQAIGRQMQYLDPDIITFNEIPVTNNCTAQMADFVAAFRPGYYLVTNSADDGYIHSVILSRFPILSSTSRLHGISLAPFGYTNANPAPYFTRDLFEARIVVPGLPAPLHMFTAHLKSGEDVNAAKRAAEAGAVSNFFATEYLPLNIQEPYVLNGDMNEDVLRPPVSGGGAIANLLGAATGLQLVSPLNPFTGSEMTWSVQDADGLSKRYDYVLPCALLFSNIVHGEVFRTDLLVSHPPDLYSNDDKVASDHLPVFLVFGNPFDAPFRLLSIGVTNRMMSLEWESISNRQYHLEASSDLVTWSAWVNNLVATGDNCIWTTNVPAAATFFRVRRAPESGLQ